MKMNHYYIYRLKDGDYLFERTTATEQSADEWVEKLTRRGHRAVWVLNHLIRGAYY